VLTRENAIKTATLFIHECMEQGISFHKVLIFGSAASNVTHSWSDIDLLIISDQFGDNIFDNLKLYAKINKKYPLIETHPYPTEQYKQGNDFIMEIAKNSIDISPNLQ
jgi:predicted nucleotidyltransferase